MEPSDHSENIDHILNSWNFEPGKLTARITEASDGRDVLQMRIEMGLLQMEISGRPDGEKPYDFDSYLEYLQDQYLTDPTAQLTEDDCVEIDREFVQLYHRRICWLALREYDKAVRDADHTLKLMDVCRDHSDDEEWIDSHEHFRPFVMFHRIQAKALIELEKHTPEHAIEQLTEGVEELRAIYEAEGEVDTEDFEADELHVRLIELRETLREQFDVGQTLNEQLADAVANERYEQAAKLRDRIHKREDMR
ncbi:UvrB/UvrC motif-containing protein [Bremerella sp. T1]|uniref:UvrB/UvrC motif-containing protein n=1 Tax=Bremerella sp. TYQ1 TaxID=3119568 RepID=UPI001CCC121A|nr:UvrB/UvrC motif-containing protein [Bremerella volcania]UBM37794.1 UvrB/UvrC motif-containing protein [Bremerella volcania]